MGDGFAARFLARQELYQEPSSRRMSARCTMLGVYEVRCQCGSQVEGRRMRDGIRGMIADMETVRENLLAYGDDIRH
jgi:hypothetical protein